MSRVVTRAELAEMLYRWQAGALSNRQVHDWAEELFGPADYDDWEGEGMEDGSVACAVLGELDQLDMNLLTVDDVPALLGFLATPPGEFRQGLADWEAEVAKRNIPARQRALRDDPVYAPFCQ
jgi:hypothetical protein